MEYDLFGNVTKERVKVDASNYLKYPQRLRRSQSGHQGHRPASVPDVSLADVGGVLVRASRIHQTLMNRVLQ